MAIDTSFRNGFFSKSVQGNRGATQICCDCKKEWSKSIQRRRWYHWAWDTGPGGFQLGTPRPGVEISPHISQRELIMCGFAGALTQPSNAASLENAVSMMASAILHRGPDDGGVWIDASAAVGLSHRRLSIVDLSAAGHQPMLSRSERFALVYNGEIYNHAALRHQLDQRGDFAWQGHSDTETLLAGFECWGVEATLQKAIGMFAFALWDRETRQLMLGRDRLGEKPLYYGWQGQSFIFGSELKALKAHPEFSATVDRNALALYMRHNCVPAPYSIYEGIRKLEPGCMLVLSEYQKLPAISQYWSGREVVQRGREDQFSGNADAAVNALEALLTDAVGQQMVADVPLGTFLSGGIDSSTIAAIMQSQATRPVRTFSIGFDEPGYNEAEHAKAVAAHLDTDHTELYVSAQQAMDVIPFLPQIYDEPFADSSQIPTYLVSKMARQHVTVALSGDAGDELFAGYNRYTMTASMWKKINALPAIARKSIATAIRALPPSAWDALASPLSRVAGGRLNAVGDKLHKGAGVLGSATEDDLYRRLVSHWEDPASVVMNGCEPPSLLTDPKRHPSVAGVERMMAFDMLTYLPDDILTKVDRAAMAVSLETRVPFLDHRVVEFAWRLPLEYKLREGQGKWVLRQVLYKHVPKALMERPKMGFGVPLAAWLRGPLREWAETLLNKQRLLQEGYFHADIVRRKWAEHLSGTRNWAYHLWDVLMFQAWLEHNVKP